MNGMEGLNYIDDSLQLLSEGSSNTHDRRIVLSETEVERVAIEAEELRILEEMKRKEFDQSLFEGLEEM